MDGSTAQLPELAAVDFNERPVTAVWELTRSCTLPCPRCPLDAQRWRDPQELTTAEAMGVVDGLVGLRVPALTLTGGDPLMRFDLFDIAAYAVSRGLRVAVSPASTAMATKARLKGLQDIGVLTIHVSLDGGRAETHDGLRGIARMFWASLRLLADLRDLGMPAQVETIVTPANVGELSEIAGLIEELKVHTWNVCFPIPTSAGRSVTLVDPVIAEHLWGWLCELSDHAPFEIQTTSAPQFRRTRLLRARQNVSGPVRLSGPDYHVDESTPGARTRGTNDGRGSLFIDHVGNVCPSRSLPIPGGNVRTATVTDIYRDSPLFTELRDPSRLEGKCGTCEFVELCGGSRARAFAMTGSYLGDDPLCARSRSWSTAHVRRERRARLEIYEQKLGGTGTDTGASMLTSWLTGYQAALDAAEDESRGTRRRPDG